MAAQQPALPPVSGFSGSTFTQGFLLGQLSIFLIIFLLIKFFIFGEPPSADDRALHLSSLRRARTLAHASSIQHSRTRSRSNSTVAPGTASVIRPAATPGHGAPSISSILAKTYYNVKGHQPESLDWFNVLVAQTIAQLRDDARRDGAVLTSLTELLNGGSKPPWIGEIKVTEIALGDEFPIFSNCRVMPAEEGFAVGGLGMKGGGGAGAGSTTGDDGREGRLQARMDVDLSDVITLGIETTLVLNYPKPRTAVLPVALAVSVVRFSGTLAVSFIPSSSPPTHSPNAAPPANTTSTADPNTTSASAPHTRQHSSQIPNPQPHTLPKAPRGHTPPGPSESPSTSTAIPTHRPTTLAFTFLDDYRLDLSVRSLVGSRSRLQDVPKIAQLIESRLHAWFDERVVEPRFQQIALPNLWPRKKNTRGGEGLDVDAADIDGEGMKEGEDDVEGDIAVPSIETSTGVKLPSAPLSLEARLEAEGAKLREAERKAGERSRGTGTNSNTASGRAGVGTPVEGMRYRGAEQLLRPQASRNDSEWSGSGQRGMPGAMPG